LLANGRMDEQCEVAIVGAGIAGASLAYFLAERGIGDVVLLEREEAPGYHATGRSAAALVEIDPPWTTTRLIVAGARFLRAPPPGFAEAPLVSPIGAVLAFRGLRWWAVRLLEWRWRRLGIRTELLDPAQAAARVPALDAAAFSGAIWLPGGGRIDVHELLSSYLKHAHGRGARLRTGAEVTSVIVENGRCVGIDTNQGVIRARWVVNAAGAWAQALARLAGAAPINVPCYRRSAFLFAPPAELDVSGWPVVHSDPHHLYFEPEAGGLLMSPMDETPSQPCDAYADELAIAEGVERLRALAPRLAPRSIKRSWAGLRTFARDRVPVVGEDPRVAGFFWLAGQGGTGIQTSPILGAVAADLIAQGKTELFDASLLSPRRTLINTRAAGCRASTTRPANRAIVRSRRPKP
jgi:D-arginine dehydrogenase